MLGVAMLMAPTVASAAPSFDMRGARRDQAAVIRMLMAKVDSLDAQVTSLRSQMAAHDAKAPAGSWRDQLQAGQATDLETPPVAIPPAPTQVARQSATSPVSVPKPGAFHFKGITLTPGGFLELAGVYRQHFQGTDIGSSFLVPLPNIRQSHVAESRFSARQSRVSLLAEGAVDANTKISAYGEFDFLGAAQTANSVESNSYNPRIRNLYAAIDWDREGHGWHVLAGQSWSLATMNTKGITPRNEALPPQIDAQFMPGFVWTRQPGIRLIGDFLDHRLWAAVSAENPQTSFGGQVPATVIAQVTGGSWFNAANTISLNHVPDVLAKLAYEANPAGHSVHVEAFGIVRSFDARLTTGRNTSAHGYAIGGGVNAQLMPGLLDVRFSGLYGTGIGRYGTSGLPDVTFSSDGRIHPIRESAMLAGLTLHATKAIDVYGFAGEERQDRQVYGQIGIGNPNANNGGCFTEGGICDGNTRRIRQLTGGFWDKFYQGSFGFAEIGMQYSHTQRQLFAGLGGAPQASQNMGLVSFRYYPF